MKSVHRVHFLPNLKFYTTYEKKKFAKRTTTEIETYIFCFHLCFAVHFPVFRRPGSLTFIPLLYFIHHFKIITAPAFSSETVERRGRAALDLFIFSCNEKFPEVSSGSAKGPPLVRAKLAGGAARFYLVNPLRRCCAPRKSQYTRGRNF